MSQMSGRWDPDRYGHGPAIVADLAAALLHSIVRYSREGPLYEGTFITISDHLNVPGTCGIFEARSRRLAFRSLKKPSSSRILYAFFSLLK